MAVLLNQTSTLRLRLELTARLSDGVRTPAALEMSVAIERYAHAQGGGREHGWERVLSVPRATLLDLDLINFLHALEALLSRPLPSRAGGPYGPVPGTAQGAAAAGAAQGESAAGGESAAAGEAAAALEASVDPAIGLRLVGGPEAYLVEVGIDLLPVLERVGGAAGLAGERGEDLALFRFVANARAAVAFSAGLIEAFERFPTDPALVDKGDAG